MSNILCGPNKRQVSINFSCHLKDDVCSLHIQQQTTASLLSKTRDATPQSGKIKKSDKCRTVANKFIKWNIVV